MHLAKVSFVESTPPHDRESAAAPLATWAQLNHGAWRDEHQWILCRSGNAVSFARHFHGFTNEICHLKASPKSAQTGLRIF
jgi:hypothetical protein